MANIGNYFKPLDNHQDEFLSVLDKVGELYPNAPIQRPGRTVLFSLPVLDITTRLEVEDMSKYRELRSNGLDYSVAGKTVTVDLSADGINAKIYLSTLENQRKFRSKTFLFNHYDQVSGVRLEVSTSVFEFVPVEISGSITFETLEQVYVQKAKLEEKIKGNETGYEQNQQLIRQAEELFTELEALALGLGFEKIKFKDNVLSEL